MNQACIRRVMTDGSGADLCRVAALAAIIAALLLFSAPALHSATRDAGPLVTQIEVLESRSRPEAVRALLDTKVGAPDAPRAPALGAAGEPLRRPEQDLGRARLRPRRLREPLRQRRRDGQGPLKNERGAHEPWGNEPTLGTVNKVLPGENRARGP